MISVYDADPTYLLGLFSEFIIFEQATDHLRERKVLDDLGPVRKARHVGHDLKNSLDWIAENYDLLPARVAFVKANIVPRHVPNLETLETLLQKPILTPLWQNLGRLHPSPRVASVLFQNLLLEENSSWYLTGDRYFQTFDDLLRFVFHHPSKRHFVPFSPGGCYLVPEVNLRNPPVGVYEFLSWVSSYRFFPPEAWAVERILWTIWTSTEDFHPRFFSKKNWSEDLPPRSAYAPKPAVLSRLGNRIVRLGSFLEMKGENST